MKKLLIVLVLVLTSCSSPGDSDSGLEGNGAESSNSSVQLQTDAATERSTFEISDGIYAYIRVLRIQEGREIELLPPEEILVKSDDETQRLDLPFDLKFSSDNVSITWKELDSLLKQVETSESTIIVSLEFSEPFFENSDPKTNENSDISPKQISVPSPAQLLVEFEVKEIAEGDTALIDWN